MRHVMFFLCAMRHTRHPYGVVARWRIGDTWRVGRTSVQGLTPV
jgi:hypothetical protein